MAIETLGNDYKSLWQRKMVELLELIAGGGINGCGIPSSMKIIDATLPPYEGTIDLTESGFMANGNIFVFPSGEARAANLVLLPDLDQVADQWRIGIALPFDAELTDEDFVIRAANLVDTFHLPFRDNDVYNENVIGGPATPGLGDIPREFTTKIGGQYYVIGVTVVDNVRKWAVIRVGYVSIREAIETLGGGGGGGTGTVETITGSDDIQVNSTDPANPVLAFVGQRVLSIVGGTNVTVDDTDPENPEVSFNQQPVRFTEQVLTAANPLVWDYAQGDRAYLTTDGDTVLQDIANMEPGDIASLVVTIGTDNDEVKFFLTSGFRIAFGQFFPANASAGDPENNIPPDVFEITILKTTQAIPWYITITQLTTVAANQGPTATPVTITGLNETGAPWLIDYNYNDVDGDVEDLSAGGSYFSFRQYDTQIAADSDLTGEGGTEIDTAAVSTAFPYGYDQQLAGKYYVMFIYPRAVAGTVNGPVARSATKGPVAAAPDTNITLTRADESVVIKQTPSATPQTTHVAIDFESATFDAGMLLVALHGEQGSSITAMPTEVIYVTNTSDLDAAGTPLTLIATHFRGGGKREFIGLFGLLRPTNGWTVAPGFLRLKFNGTPDAVRAASWAVESVAQAFPSIKPVDNWTTTETTTNFGSTPNSPINPPVDGVLVTFATHADPNRLLVPLNDQTRIWNTNVGGDVTEDVLAKEVLAGSQAYEFNPTGMNGTGITIFLTPA